MTTENKENPLGLGGQSVDDAADALKKESAKKVPQFVKRKATQKDLDDNPDKGYQLGHKYEFPNPEYVVDDAADANSGGGADSTNGDGTNPEPEAPQVQPEKKEDDDVDDVDNDDIFNNDHSFLREPTEAEIELAANNEQVVAICRMVIERADAIAAEKNKPEPLGEEEMKALNHSRLIGLYGPDFVTAKKGNNHTYFSRKSWSMMPTKKNGWVEIENTDVMPEVQALDQE